MRRIAPELRRRTPQFSSCAVRGLHLVWLSLCVVQAAASTARAHSAPGVAAILDEDATGVHSLRLYAGLVRRAGNSWRFVCSKVYGGVGQDLAASLPGGGVAIAIPNGIVLMQRDGTFEAHPDPAAQRGTVTAFARTQGKLYALRAAADSPGMSEVVAITATTVEVLWSDTRAWNDIAVGESSLALVRFENDVIEELRLSFAGEVISRQPATLFDALAVTVRVLGDVPYYTARLQSSSVLGRIQRGAWQVVLTTGNALAGPLALSDGTVMVALDGALSTFANDSATRLMDSEFVIGLSQLDGHPYECTRTGLRELSSSGSGAVLFDFSQLLGPDECSVPDALRSDCELEWQHLQVELLGANIPLATEAAGDGVCPSSGALAMPAASAGTSATVASAGSAGAAADLGMQGAAGQTMPSGPAAGAGGCDLVSGAARTAPHMRVIACGLLVAYVLRRRLRIVRAKS